MKFYVRVIRSIKKQLLILSFDVRKVKENEVNKHDDKR